MKGKRNALVIFVLEHMRASLVYCFLAVVCFLLYAAFNLMSRQGVRATTGDVTVLSNGLEDVDWLQDRPIFFSMTLSVATTLLLGWQTSAEARRFVQPLGKPRRPWSI